MADALATSRSVDSALHNAVQAFRRTPLPESLGIVPALRLFDIAGIGISRPPRLRIVPTDVKRRRFKGKLAAAGQPRHVKKAIALLHRYELVLRQFIDEAMSAVFGNRWPEDRLPKCDCKGLLGRWHKNGGVLLDHADFAHYSRIMCHSEHYSQVFAIGFPDGAGLTHALNEVRRLRAASHHAKIDPTAFTLRDLADLRLALDVIEVGLMALEPD
jgi:hypothetical protein